MKALLIWLAFTSAGATPVVYNPGAVLSQERCEAKRLDDERRNMALTVFKNQGIEPDKLQGLCVPFDESALTVFHATEGIKN